MGGERQVVLYWDMAINAFFITIIIAISLKFIFDWVTDYLTLRSLNPELPDKVAGIYDPDTDTWSATTTTGAAKGSNRRDHVRSTS